MSPDEVRTFQAAHVDHLGEQLVADGILGPKTQWALDLFRCSPRRRQVVARAQSRLGVTEEPPGSNRGLRIDEWLQRCHTSSGQPWCAAFASWCLDTVAIAGALALGSHFPPLSPGAAPWPGDVMFYATGGGKGHCGIVLGVSAHEVMTIEGNCQDAVRCVRRARDQLRFARTGNDLQGKPPASMPAQPFLATSVEGTR